MMKLSTQSDGSTESLATFFREDEDVVLEPIHGSMNSLAVQMNTYWSCFPSGCEA